jgi:hypothetical protein
MLWSGDYEYDELSKSGYKQKMKVKILNNALLIFLGATD